MLLKDNEDFRCFKVDLLVLPMEGSSLCFQDGKWEYDCDNYYDSFKRVEINVSNDKDKPIAYIQLYLVPSDYAYFNPDETLELADSYTQDSYDEFEKLLYSAFFRKCYKESCERAKFKNKMSYSGSIQNFYIYPEYRRTGLALFLLKNINAIMYKFLQTEILCLTAVLNPFVDDDISKGSYAKSKESMNSEEIKMLDAMRKFMRKAGFKKIRGMDDWYIGCVYK